MHIMIDRRTHLQQVVLFNLAKLFVNYSRFANNFFGFDSTFYNVCLWFLRGPLFGQKGCRFCLSVLKHAFAGRVLAFDFHIQTEMWKHDRTIPRVGKIASSQTVRTIESKNMRLGKQACHAQPIGHCAPGKAGSINQQHAKKRRNETFTEQPGFHSRAQPLGTCTNDATHLFENA